MSRILLFSSSVEESRRLASLVRGDDITVVESFSPLEVMHILKTDRIDMVLASHSLSDIEKNVFRSMVEATSPGVSMMFLGPYSPDGKVYFTPDALGQHIRDSVALTKSLKENIKSLKDFSFAFADRLLQIFEVDDRYFFNNCNLTAELSEEIARRMGLDENMIETIRMAALIKDLGRVGIQNEILEAVRRFDQNEMISLKKHPLNTVEMLKHLNFPWNIESLVAQHHEHYDGSGYPMGLKGRQISLGARIIHIAESYVAMTAERPYRKAFTKEDALQEIARKAGSQFDPEIAEIFISIIKELPESARTCVMIVERSPNVSALMKLGSNTSKMDILSVSNSFEALRQARVRKPDLVIVDVEIFETDTFSSFFGRLRRVHSLEDKPFMLIIPDDSHARRFEGEGIHFLTKPVDMALLIGAVNRILTDKKVQPDMQEEVAGLTGSLEDFGLDDIIQILNLGLKTAKVDVASGVKKGVIYLLGGKIVYASMDDTTGKEAFQKMLGWTEGSFRIRHGETTNKSNINMNTVQLLLESARAKDHMRSA